TTMVRSYAASAAAGSPYMSPVVSAKAELAADSVSAATAGMRTFTMCSIQEFWETDSAPVRAALHVPPTLVRGRYRDSDRRITFLKYSGHPALRSAGLGRLDPAEADHVSPRRCQRSLGRVRVLLGDDHGHPDPAVEDAQHLLVGDAAFAL